MQKQDLINKIAELHGLDRLPNGKTVSIDNVSDYIFSLKPDFIHQSTNQLTPYSFSTIKKEVNRWRRKRKHTDDDTVVIRPFVPVQQKPLTEKIKQRVYNKHDKPTLSELSDAFDCGITKIRQAIEELQSTGYNISIENDYVIFDNLIQKNDDTVLSIEKNVHGFYRMGVCGDNHLCSKYERLDVLNALYDKYEAEGITVVYNTGNWIDGEARFNKHDLHTHGLDNQIRYMIEKYPQRKGITTKYITGDDHEGWYTQREGVDVGRYLQYKALEAGRSDLVFLGHMEHDEIIKAPNGQTKLRVLHPGGGSSYAISYTSQKIVESYTGGDKPDILIDGHYHKAGYNFIRGVHVVQAGCTQDQTPFMRKKKLAAHLGGWIIDFTTDDKGAVIRFRQEFFPFFDKQYYSDSWKYRWQ
jgi:hypothetical protein